MKDEKGGLYMNKKIRVLGYSFSILVLLLLAGAIYKNVSRNHNVQENAATLIQQQESEEPKANDANTGEGSSEQEDTNTTESKEADNSKQSQMQTETTAINSETNTTLLFTGDILLGNSVTGNYATKGIDGILSKDMQEQMNSADITMVNEEFPFSNGGTAMQDKQYTFRVDPKYVTAFLEMGIDVVSIANNHTLDYGTTALTDTCNTLDQAKILYAGAGATKERAMQLITIQKNGKTFGFLAASRVLPKGSWNVENKEPGIFSTYDPTALLAAIKSAKASCDYLTVFVHWGVERSQSPQDYQRSLGKQYIESGADLVIGSHTHCLEGVEYFDGKPVFYSLGNFLFGNDGQTAAVKVTVDESNQASYQFIPAKEVSAYTSIVSGEDAQNIFDTLNSISLNATIKKDGTVQQKQ